MFNLQTVKAKTATTTTTTTTAKLNKHPLILFLRMHACKNSCLMCKVVAAAADT